jgi:hypothetical protein
VLDSECRRASREAVQKPDPGVPGGAATRVIGLFHDATNIFEGRDVFGLLAERELDLGLLTTASMRRRRLGLVSSIASRRASASSKYANASLFAQRRCDFSAARMA